MVQETGTTHYPDVLGYVTGGSRLNIGVVQIALAIRPKVVRAGRPFEVLILLQNASDSPVDVTLTLHLPERDAAKQKGRFIAKVNRLVIGLQPAEVGYALLPVATLPDTASAKDYRIAMEVAAKASGKPQRVRSTEGGVPLETRRLRRTLKDELAAMQELSFSTEKRGLMGGSIEVTFSLLPGKVGAITDLQPGWHSLWTLQDMQTSDFSLARKFGSEMRDQVLPRLNRERVFKPMLTRVEALFQDAGYPLSSAEAGFVARLLTLILTYAATGSDAVDNVDLPPAPRYQVGPFFTEERYLQPNATDELPYWVNGLMRAISQDQRASQYPVQGIVHFAFDDLLMDAMRFALDQIEKAVGVELGDTEEHETYAQQIVDRLHRKGEMDFTSAYLPLVMGGMLIHDLVLMPNEKRLPILDSVRPMLRERQPQLRPGDEDVYEMAQSVARIILLKYGYEL